LTRDQVDEYYLTVAEVAELLRLNQQTVRNWIDQGSLPALRVGRRVRIKQSDLDRLLTEGYSAGAQGGSGDPGPSAEDFWGGEPVGFAEVAVGVSAEVAETGTNGVDSGANHGGRPSRDGGPAAQDLGPGAQDRRPAARDGEPAEDLGEPAADHSEPGARATPRERSE
jgi:excisionase family DNA binding protein